MSGDPRPPVDGIVEEDNPLPRWWVALFVSTVAVAAVYSVLYPSLWCWGGVLHWSSADQHAREDAQAKAFYAGFSEAAVAAVDLERLSHDSAVLAEGREIFMQYCAPCHGAEGQGGVGLPLRGPTWKWGGDSRSMLATIRLGRPPSVMPAWSRQMPLERIAKVGAYAYSLRYGAPGADGASPGAGGSTPGVGGSAPGAGGASPGAGGSTPGVGGSAPGAGGASR